MEIGNALIIYSFNTISSYPVIGVDLMDIENMRSSALKMIKKGIQAADPEKLVQKNIDLNKDKIKICNQILKRSDFNEIVVIGIGKASFAMASGCKKLHPDDVLIITKKGYGNEKRDDTIKILKGDHPYPNKNSFNAAREIISKIGKKKDCLFIILISGGGSSLFTIPHNNISIQEVSELNRMLIESGADIHQINTVRKHISQVKGGKFGELCGQHGNVISLILSDVVGDDMSDIASGPTYPDNTSFKDAKDVLKKYDLWKKIPEGIKKHIENGLAGKVEETPEKVDADNYLIGNNLLALREMKRIGAKEGFNTKILTSQNTGEAKEIAKPFAGIAKEIQDSSNPLKPPAALLIGGETTVDISGENSKKIKGGPNREFVLSFALEVRNKKNIVAASVDSDGTDGVGKAGAIADTTSIKRCELDAEKLLAKHDSQRFFDYLGDSIEFESKTNVNDLTVILIDEI